MEVSALHRGDLVATLVTIGPTVAEDGGRVQRLMHVAGQMKEPAVSQCSRRWCSFAIVNRSQCVLRRLHAVVLFGWQRSWVLDRAVKGQFTLWACENGMVEVMPMRPIVWTAAADVGPDGRLPENPTILGG